MNTTDYRAWAAGLPPFTLGTCADGTPFTLTWDQIRVHMAVLGGSGSGKSKFLELLFRHFMLYGVGFFFLDPHSDTANNLFAFAGALKAHPTLRNDTVWKKVHFLSVGPRSAFSYDPFAPAPRRTEVHPREYAAWMDTKINRLCDALLRGYSEADQEGMVRRKRWLRNALHFCGTSFDLVNTHHGLGKLLVALDPGREREFGPLFADVADWLNPDVRADYAKLIGTKRPRDQEAWVESTLNLLREDLTTLVQDVFSQRAPSIDVLGIIREGGFLIADFGQTPHWSHRQKVKLGGMLIQEVLLAKEAEERTLPPSRRRPFVLAVDESGEFLGDDLKRALGATRKYELPIILAGQDLSTFAKGDLDMAPKILSMCQTVVCFQNKYRKDQEILAPRVGTGDLGFTKRLREVQRQRGLLKILLEDHSHGTGTSEGSVESESENEVVSEMLAVMRGHARMASTSDGTAAGTNSSDSAQESLPMLVAPGSGSLLSPIPVPPAFGTASKGKQRGVSHQNSHVESSGTVDSEALTQGQGKARGRGKSRGRSKTNSRTHTVAQKTQLVPNLVSEFEWDGGFDEGTAADQFEVLMQKIHCLSTAEAIVSALGERRSREVKVAEVKEWWANEDDKFRAVERLKAMLAALRPYHFDPCAETDPEPEAEPAVVIDDVFRY